MLHSIAIQVHGNLVHFTGPADRKSQLLAAVFHPPQQHRGTVQAIAGVIAPPLVINRQTFNSRNHITHLHPGSLSSTSGQHFAHIKAIGGIIQFQILTAVAANLAVALAKQGYKVGLLDADIFGPSMPKMFQVEDARPYAERIDGRDLIIPIESYGVKLLSIGFFVDPAQATIWRGGMASNALKHHSRRTIQ